VLFWAFVLFARSLLLSCHLCSLGVLLAAGATFQVDDNTAQRLNFRACDRNGCYANSSVSPDVLAALRKGTQLKIGFQNLAEKPITVPLSLDGFGEAYEKMEKPS
jgi:invasion protein IalB